MARRVRPGDKFSISATEYNRLLAAAEELHRNRLSGGRGPRTYIRDAATVRVHNVSGDTIPIGGLVGFDEPLTDPTAGAAELARFVRDATVKIVLPIETIHLGRIGIAIEPIAPGKVGRVVFAGVVAARVNVIKTWHHFADVGESVGDTLQSKPDGSAQILWRRDPLQLGDQWAVVRIGKPSRVVHLIKVPVGGIAARTNSHTGKAECELYRIDSNGDIKPVLDSSGEIVIIEANNHSAQRIRGPVSEEGEQSLRVEYDEAGCWVIDPPTHTLLLRPVKRIKPKRWGNARELRHHQGRWKPIGKIVFAYNACDYPLLPSQQIVGHFHEDTSSYVTVGCRCCEEESSSSSSYSSSSSSSSGYSYSSDSSSSSSSSSVSVSYGSSSSSGSSSPSSKSDSSSSSGSSSSKSSSSSSGSSKESSGSSSESSESSNKSESSESSDDKSSKSDQSSSDQSDSNPSSKSDSDDSHESEPSSSNESDASQSSLESTESSQSDVSDHLSSETTQSESEQASSDNESSDHQSTDHASSESRSNVGSSEGGPCRCLWFVSQNTSTGEYDFSLVRKENDPLDECECVAPTFWNSGLGYHYLACTCDISHSEHEQSDSESSKSEGSDSGECRNEWITEIEEGIVVPRLVRAGQCANGKPQTSLNRPNIPPDYPYVNETIFTECGCEESSGSERDCQCVYESVVDGESFAWILTQQIGGDGLPDECPPREDIPNEAGLTEHVPCGDACNCLWIVEEYGSELRWALVEQQGNQPHCGCHHPPLAEPIYIGQLYNLQCECLSEGSSHSDEESDLSEADSESSIEEECWCWWKSVKIDPECDYLCDREWVFDYKQGDADDECECTKKPDLDPNSAAGFRKAIRCDCHPSHHSDSGSTQDPSIGGGSSDHEQSDKSTAIVPASFTDGGFTALYTLETPEVRFDDTMTVSFRGDSVTVDIDPKYVEVCEAGTITVCAAVPDEPVVVGAKVVDGRKVRIKLGHYSSATVSVSIRLTAIRRGFLGKRFPNRTQEQFNANERTLRSAYPGAGQ